MFAFYLYARSLGHTITVEFYDTAVSGDDPIDQCPRFAALLREITAIAWRPRSTS